MPVAQPPFALIPPAFRFAALASLAGRAPLGGRREVVLAVYMAARLAEDALPAHDVSREARGERAGHAKQWLSTLALPATMRPALIALIEASAADAPLVCRSLRAALAAVAEGLDKNSRAEVTQLIAALEAA